MAGLRLDRVTKRFGPVTAVDAVDLAVDPGEFVALLGPSGCGKTTLLRLLAGFERPDDGMIAIAGETVADRDRHLPPERRRLGMVFQSYALWPHMSVAENVGYALKVRRLPKAERERKVAAALELVGLGALADRRPAALSGGQRQRVALARCLAMDPSVVLLDEPLANLDVHLRDSMQAEFRRFHGATGATLVYVTHDQAEAMALADRVAVMEDGGVRQFAPPRALYAEPATAMVARFVGRGMVVPVTVRGRAQATGGTGAGQESLRVAADLWGVPVGLRARAAAAGPARACLRAEALALADPAEAAAGRAIAARVERTAFHGAATTVVARPEADPDVELHLATSGPPPEAGSAVAITVADGWVLPE